MQELINNLNIIKNATSEVYEAGQENAVDADKIIEKSVSGNRFVTANDVSEVKHDVTINAPSGTKLNVYGKNLFDIDSQIYTVRTGLTVTKNEDGTYNIRGNLPTSTNYQYCGEFPFFIPSGTTVTTSTYFDTTTETACIGITMRNSSNAIIHQHTGNYVSGESKTTTLTNDCTTVGFVWKFANGVSGSYIEINNIKLQLELNGKATDYEPFKGQSITIDSTGTATVKSCSPKMLITCNSDADITMNYHKSYGIQTEYDRFWDVYQDRGNRTSYRLSYSGYGWNNETFKPKYDMNNISNAYGMFWSSRIKGDLVEILKNLNINFDSSNATQCHYMFSSCAFTRVGEINATGSTGFTSMFSTTSNLKTIDKLILKDDGSQTFPTAFNAAYALENITIEGVIGNNFDIHWSPLNKTSIMSIYNALSTTATGKTVSFKKTAVNTAFETSAGAADGSTSTEWTNLVATKSNWTFSLS